MGCPFASAAASAAFPAATLRGGPADVCRGWVLAVARSAGRHNSISMCWRCSAGRSAVSGIFVARKAPRPHSAQPARSICKARGHLGPRPSHIRGERFLGFPWTLSTLLSSPFFQHLLPAAGSHLQVGRGTGCGSQCRAKESKSGILLDCLTRRGAGAIIKQNRTSAVAALSSTLNSPCMARAQPLSHSAHVWGVRRSGCVGPLVAVAALFTSQLWAGTCGWLTAVVGQDSVARVARAGTCDLGYSLPWSAHTKGQSERSLSFALP